MADNSTIQPSGLSLQPYTLDSLGQMGKDIALGQMKDIASQHPTDLPKNLINGQTITDLLNQAGANQAKTTDFQNGMSANSSQANNHYFDITGAFDQMNQEALNAKPSFDFLKKGVALGTGEDYKRYSQSGNFQALGYTPGAGDRQEFKYGEAMTWTDTIGRALGGGAHLALNTFEEGWKGWGRMASALFNLDSSKLMGSEDERYDLAKEQEDIFNKYAIYDTKDSKDSIWNRQFLGSMLQQSGFAVGAGLQFAMEEYLTGGLATAFGGFGLAKLGKSLVRAEELINDTRKVGADVLRSEKLSENIASKFIKNVVPFYGTAENMVKLSKAGAGTLQLAMTGLGGVKRALSEFNMARSEAIYEAASTYKQLQDKLVNEYIAKNGKTPDADEMEKMKTAAENASHDNFWVNMGVLSVMNKMEFDNMFKSFDSTRRIFNEGVHELEDQAYKVSVKNAEKDLTKAYQTHWFFGKAGALPEISKDFGKKTAAWEATKMLGKGLMKIEGSEGVQELLQNASDQGLEDYYYDLYHGAHGYGDNALQRYMDKFSNIKSGFVDQTTTEEGLKTFLMGALTGALISPGAKVITHINTLREDAAGKKLDPEYQTRKQRAQESIDLINEWYANDKSKFKNEWIANVKVQNKAAESMEEAAKNHDKYTFYNYKDSAFSKMLGAAIKLNMYDSVRDSIKELGSDLKTDKEFKEAFGMEPTKQNRGNVKALMENVTGQMDEYYTTYSNLKDKYGDIVLPELYKNNDKDTYQQMKIAKLAVDDAIEILTTNVHKAKQTVKRAVQLQTEIAQNKNIGGSSAQIVTKMGSEQAIKDSINTLTTEIKSVEAAGVTLPKEQREQLNAKKRELELTHAWAEAHDAIMGNKDDMSSEEQSYSPAVERRAYETFKDLVNHFNKQSKLSTVLSKEDVDDNFMKFVDYIKLNRDNKAYVDAVNLLADPKNFSLVTTSMRSAHERMNEIFNKEHVKEIVKASGVEPTELETKKKESTPKKPVEENIPASTEDDIEEPKFQATVETLKGFLHDQYENIKDNDENFTISEEVWIKSGGANRYIALFNSQNGSKFTKEDVIGKQQDKEKIKEQPADPNNAALVEVPSKLTSLSKPPEAKAEERPIISKMLFDGKLGRVIEINKISPEDMANPNIKDKKSDMKYLDENNKEHRLEYFLRMDKDGNPDFVFVDPVTGEIVETAPYNDQKPEEKATTIITSKLNDVDSYIQKGLEFISNKIENSANKDIALKDSKDALKRYGFTDDQIKELNKLTGNTTYGKLQELQKRLEGKDLTNALDDFAADTILDNFRNRKEQTYFDSIVGTENDFIEQPQETPSGEMIVNEPYLAKNVISDISQPALNKRNDIEQMGIDAAEKTEHISRNKQVEPFNSLANITDLTTTVNKGNIQTYERGAVNENYVGPVATSEFMPGALVTYKVITDQDKPVVNRLTGETYDVKGSLENGKVKADKFDTMPIGVYSNINGKEQLIGHLHEPSWISYKVGDNFVHMVVPDEQKGMSMPTAVAEEVEKNRKLRNKIISEFNKNPTFAYNAHVSEKSIGMIRLVNDLGLLKDRVHPDIAKGGTENRHGMFAIIRGGSIYTDPITITNVISTKAFAAENVDKYEGMPLLLLPTPTGELFPTLIQIPKVNKGQAGFISKAWRAFTDSKQTDTETIEAVYKALGRVYDEGKPDIHVLKDYLNAYVTLLSAQSIVKLSDKNPNIPLGSARLNIATDGILYFTGYFDATKGVEKYVIDPNKKEDISAELEEKFEKLLTTVRFSDVNGQEGINSKDDMTALSVVDGKLKVDRMPYNQYLMNRASTYVDKGIESKNNNNDWIYFANPVIKMNIVNKPAQSDIFEKKESKPEELVTAQSIEEAPKESLAQRLLAKKRAERLSDEEIEKRKDQCASIDNLKNSY